MNRCTNSVRERGFTLVELLVVIAIIGVLVALLLPAVQAAREAARRIECTNKVKQLVLAMHNYHDVHGTFPFGNSAGVLHTPNDYSRTWITRTLPFIEQQALWDQLDDTLPIGDDSAPNVNTAVAKAAVPALLCPSDDNEGGTMLGTRYIPTTRWGVTNYVGVMGSQWVRGDAACRHTWHRGRAAGSDFLYGNNGIIPLTANGAAIPGWAGWDDPKFLTRMRDIRDGTSNTLAVGEIVTKWRAHCGWFHLAVVSHTGCPLNYESDFIRNNRTATLENRWMDWENNYGFYSRHPGGANFGLADGSVRFVSGTIDLFTYRMLANMESGEAVQLP